MRIGIGLPNAVPGATGDQLLEFARRADEAGFSSLGTIDRIVYANHEPLTALAGAAAVTDRITLATTILIVPYRVNAALLAKQAATVNSLAGGRLLLGMAVGGREDDYEASGVEFQGRGRRMDEMLAEMERVWESDSIGPAGRPDVILGGSAAASYRRAAAHGSGWIMGGGTPDMLREGREKALAAWKEAGREVEPSIRALAYYSLGPDAERNAQSYLTDYYAWLGEYSAQIADSAAKDADTVRGYIAAFEDAGCDELILFPAAADAEQVDLLADAAL